MSLRRSSYVAPKSPNGVSKKQNGRCPREIALRLKKVCYKVFLCENCQRQSCQACIGLSNHTKIIGGGRPLLPEILDQSDRVGAKSPTSHLFSLVTPSEKVQLTLIGSPLSAFQWAQDEHCTLSLRSQRVARKRKVSEIWTINCDNSETVRDRMSVTINH